MQLGFIVILIMAIFVAIFAIQNGTPVPVDLFLARYEMPLAVIMMFCLILGAVIVLILGAFRQFKKSSELKDLKNKIKALENDKVLYDNNVKALETEIQTLKESNNSLLTKISELQEKTEEQKNKVSDFNSERDNLTKEETEINSEGIGTESNNEKSETYS